MHSKKIVVTSLMFFVASAVLFWQVFSASAVSSVTSLGDDIDIVGKLTTGGNIGIGTTTPAQRLVITNTGGNTNLKLTDTGFNTADIHAGAASNALVRFGSGGTLRYAIGVNNADNSFRIAEDSGTGFASTRFTIGDTGNIGIGTTSPARGFHAVVGDAFRFERATTNVGANFEIYNPNQTNGNGSEFTWRSRDINGVQRSGAFIRGIFVTHNASSLNSELSFGTSNNSAGIERMRINAAGHVGIGITTPNVPLHIAGSAPTIITEDNIGGAGNTAALRIISSNNVNYIQTGTATTTGATADLRFTSMGTTATYMTIKNTTGNIGIGTINPTNKLDVNGDSIRVENSKTPASAIAPCNKGEIAWDANAVYVCVATNTWKKAALTTF